VVADSFSRIFEGRELTDQEEWLLAMIQGLPLAYTSLDEHQKGDHFCKDALEALKRGDPTANQFWFHKYSVLSTERHQKERLRGSGDLAPEVVEIHPRLPFVRAFELF